MGSLSGVPGEGYAVTSITGTIGGEPITGEVGSDGATFVSADGLWIADNEIFATGGVDGNVDGLDLDGLLFEANGIEYNLYSENGSIVLGSSLNGSLIAADAPTSTVTSDAPCFCQGTRILTNRGEVAVDDLRHGDLIVTRFGPLRPVKWIGRHSYVSQFVEKHRAPVRIRAGALGGNVPCRDLFVSPGHRMVIDDSLVQAAHLVNGVTITQESPDSVIHYYHVDFGVHDCLIAEGAWTESYAEQNNRSAFHNAAEFAAAFPGHEPEYQTECLPVAESDPEKFKTIQMKILQNVPGATLTSQAALQLVADGSPLEPVKCGGGVSVFRVPAGTRSLRLLSNASKPLTVGINRDSRRLGVLVNWLTASFSDVVVSLRLDSEALADGWHRPEHSKDGQVFRWTNGDAALPASLLPCRTEDVELELRWGHLARYFIAPAAGDASCAGALSIAA